MAITVTAPTILPLSKTWTFQMVKDNLRVLLDEATVTNITDLMIVGAINEQLPEVCELLNESAAPDYGSRATVTGITTETEFSLSALGVDKLVMITDTANKLWLEKKDKEFYNVSGIPQYTKNVCFYKFGESVTFAVGATATALTSLTVTVHYYRQPKLLTDETASTKIDLPDKYIALLIDKVKMRIYEHISKQPPEALRASIDSKIMAIRGLNAVENKSIKEKATTKGV